MVRRVHLSPTSRVDNNKKGKVGEYLNYDKNFVLEEIVVERDQERVVERDQGKRKESNEVYNTKQAFTSEKTYNPPIPFPNRSRTMNEEKKFSKFLDILKKLEVSLPFTEAVTQMPLYTKFLKDVLTKKRSIGVDGLVVLCDLSASVSIPLLPIARKVGSHDMIPTSMTLKLADRSIQRLMGVIEDIPVNVGNFYIPVDFVVLDISEDQQTPIILGRPFLATGDVNISVTEGKLTFKVGQNVVEFSLTGAMSQPIFKSVYLVDMLEEVIENIKDKCSGEHLDEDYEALPPLLHEDEGKTFKCPQRNKKAIGYSLDDLTGTDPRICMHRITLEDGFTPSAQPMRRLNEKLKEVVWKEVDKLLAA
ncbi:uncharacterized protein LOC141614314 [Silene latifolia]|uniref:uncharacterized protein LOC141614314 n=1 Tax=Silene latifolia TaxID=37657 RepID=UPI003D781EAA